MCLERLDRGLGHRTQQSKPLCAFEGCNRGVWAGGGVCRRRGGSPNTKVTRLVSARNRENFRVSRAKQMASQ
jgi:hypothetical protein